MILFIGTGYVLSSPEFSSQVDVEVPHITPASQAVRVVQGGHLQFLLDVSGGRADRSHSPVASAAPANHSGQIVPELGGPRLSELIQAGSEHSKI